MDSVVDACIAWCSWDWEVFATWVQAVAAVAMVVVVLTARKWTQVSAKAAKDMATWAEKQVEAAEKHQEKMESIQSDIARASQATAKWAATTTRQTRSADLRQLEDRVFQAGRDADVMPIPSKYQSEVFQFALEMLAQGILDTDQFHEKRYFDLYSESIKEHVRMNNPKERPPRFPASKELQLIWAERFES